MTDKAEIDKAVAAHGMWKTRLKMAIDTGTVEVPVETIKQDNQCAIGKWFYGATLTAADKTSAHYKSVKDLHAKFHKSAARVAELALAGKKPEAEALMALRGEFSDASADLTAAMIAWKKSIG